MQSDARKTALVLSGGSIKGAFQAGALEIVLGQRAPAFISGISVGSLNTVWLPNEAGAAARRQQSVDWAKLGRGLASFWQERVTRPDDLVCDRHVLRLLFDLLFEKFDGVVDTEPLRKLIGTVVNRTNLQACPFDFRVGAVDYYSGKTIYRGKSGGQLDEETLEYVMGSSAIPVAMPAAKIGNRILFDGGLRDVAPMSEAMASGADEVIVIACFASQPLDLDARDRRAAISHENLEKLALRVADIMTVELLNADIDYAREINDVIDHCQRASISPEAVSILKNRDGSVKTKRQITVIRPDPDFMADIRNFTSHDIREMLELGRQAAQQAMDESGAAAVSAAG